MKFSTAFYLMLFLFWPNIYGQNISLNKSYTLSESPNYNLTATPSDLKSLTDGVYTQSKFWYKPTTVGWQAKSGLTISIDLEKIQIIGSLSFSTVKDASADVYYPAHIFVFLSHDNQEFSYAGDALTGILDKEVGYQVEKFTLKSINQSARFVKLKIVTKGYYLFCDEIEILKGRVKNDKPQLTIAAGDLDRTVLSFLNTEYFKRNILSDLNRVYNSKSNSMLFSSVNYEILKKQINKSSNIETLDKIQLKIGTFNSKILNSRYSTSFLLGKRNPWAEFDPVYIPPRREESLSYNFVMPVKGVQYGAFVITNTKNTSQKFNILTKNNSFNDILNIYKAVFVTAENYQKVPDALVPVEGTVTIKPGISELIIFMLTSVQKETGVSTISVSSAYKKTDIKINFKSIDLLSSGISADISAVNWGYLTFNMITNQKAAAVSDMVNHHINTVVVPSQYMPNPGDFNFSGLVKYLTNFPAAKKIVLFSNYESAGNHHLDKRILFMTPAWKDSFHTWYLALLNTLNNSGISTASVYFYPYDEVQSKDMADFKSFSAWARPTIQGLKIFATFSTSESFDNLYQGVDIAQILSESFKVKAKQGLPEIWMYKTKNNSRALSPYSYYRLMAWEAYLNDFKGIGFWNYADIGTVLKHNSVTNSTLDWRADYAVIYNGDDNKILSSRRWEAFKLGIEDYRILKLFENKYGILSAKMKAKRVIDEQNDLDLADNIRIDMISKLY